MMTIVHRTGIASSMLVLFTFGTTAATTVAAEDTLPTEKQCSQLENPDAATQGWCVAIDRRKGNCLACHTITTAQWPAALPPGGNIAPPLIAMQKRYPDQTQLRAQIWDALAANPRSVMPPFGKYEIITEQDIDNIVAFLWSI